MRNRHHAHRLHHAGVGVSRTYFPDGGIVVDMIVRQMELRSGNDFIVGDGDPFAHHNGAMQAHLRGEVVAIYLIGEEPALVTPPARLTAERPALEAGKE